MDQLKIFTLLKRRIRKNKKNNAKIVSQLMFCLVILRKPALLF